MGREYAVIGLPVYELSETATHAQINIVVEVQVTQSRQWMWSGYGANLLAPHAIRLTMCFQLRELGGTFETTLYPQV